MYKFLKRDVLKINKYYADSENWKTALRNQVVPTNIEEGDQNPIEDDDETEQVIPI